MIKTKLSNQIFNWSCDSNAKKINIFFFMIVNQILISSSVCLQFIKYNIYITLKLLNNVSQN
jgi:hypothetical protein